MSPVLAADASPVIVTSGEAEVKVPAGRVLLDITVEVHDRSASQAAADVAELHNRVVTALGTLGLDSAELPSSGYWVEPDYDWEEKRIKGYGASTGIQLDLDDTSLLGQVIDTALAAGANGISSVTYLPEDERAARDRALEMAFESARRDAEVLAAAAGRRLGRPLDISTPTYTTSELEEAIVVTAESRTLGTRLRAPEDLHFLRTEE